MGGGGSITGGRKEEELELTWALGVCGREGFLSGILGSVLAFGCIHCIFCFALLAILMGVFLDSACQTFDSLYPFRIRILGLLDPSVVCHLHIWEH